MNKRKLYFTITDQLIKKEFCIIAGPRQVGKTVLLSQIADFLREKNEQVFSFTLEDPAILARLNNHPEKIFDFIFPDRKQRLYLMIDEIQYLDNPSNFLKLLYDQYQPWLKIVATGSSAFYIDSKFKDSLAGRKQLYELYTLGFDEFLDFRTGNTELSTELVRIRENTGYISIKFQELENLLNEYLIFGGYPAVVLAPDTESKKLILRELLFSFVKRDIMESNINDSEKFYNLMLLLSHQTGSLLNVNELAGILKLSVTAVENYLYVLRKCYHIHLIRPFFRNIRKELTKMPKIYYNDLGMRNILMNQFNPVFQRSDKGELIENYAYIRLRETRDNDSLFYWRTTEGNEIDFVLRDTFETGEAIEIKYNYSSFNKGKYIKFTKAYPGFPISCFAWEGPSVSNKIISI
jgi:uncharacterized protein